MLKRIYIDNYKCLVNFDYAPKRTQLIMGTNGAGKSAIFDVLCRLRQVITGEKKISESADPPFPTTCLTSWESQREKQSFELEVEGNGGAYEYKLELDHKRETRQCRITSEALTFNGQPLLSFVNGEITIYREDHRVGAQFTFDWGQSAFATLAERTDNRLHRWFRDWIGQLQVVCPNPFDMISYSEREHSRLNANATNFVSWYRHIDDEMLGMREELKASLVNVWEGFQGMRLETVGPDVKALKVAFQKPSAEGKGNYEVLFGDLSDGQRVLIGLYTLRHYLERAAGSLICIDEPDNFVTLAEIQPWLMSVCQIAEDQNSQVLFISHHPELINYLAPRDAVVLTRTNGGPTRAKSFRSAPGSRLTPAESIARGWENE